MKNIIILCGNNNSQLLQLLESEEFSSFSRVVWPEIGNDGLPVSHIYQRARIKDFIRESEKDNIVIITHSEIVINTCRVMVLREKIQTKIFWYRDSSNARVVLSVDLNGRFSSKPYGFFDTGAELLYELISGH